ncbi:MAG: aminoglycoside phosphotransferase family protein, partial [Chloroflexota bacterium]|nr:aminoglycoside phosphotransferase family protein [Chloroflexota bacterium]
METPPIPKARGKRLEWDALPVHIIRTIDLALGDPIVATTTIHGGFSPGIACIARTFGGQEFFVKAACSVPNEHAPAFHRREITIASRFGPEVPAPKLVWSFDEDAPGWVVLVYEVVHGHNPELPWRSGDVD